MSRPPLPVLLPIAALLFIVIIGGGLGATFIFLNKTGLEEKGAIVIGLVLVVGVPAVASLLSLPKR